MSELALEERLERFSRNYLPTPLQQLDEVASSQLRSMLTDAGYQQMEWKHPHHFYARQTQGSAIDLFMEYNLPEKKEGFSYLRAENVFVMREFEKKCEAWLDLRSNVARNIIFGAAFGLASSFLLTLGRWTMSGVTEESTQWAFYSRYIPTALGALIGFYLSRAKEERKAEQDSTFIQKYKPLMATDGEAILQALAAA